MTPTKKNCIACKVDKARKIRTAARKSTVSRQAVKAAAQDAITARKLREAYKRGYRKGHDAGVAFASANRGAWA